MSKRKALDPEYDVCWRGVQVRKVRAPTIDAAVVLARRVTGRPDRELSVSTMTVEEFMAVPT
jgi:hypothetical protein